MEFAAAPEEESNLCWRRPTRGRSRGPAVSREASYGDDSRRLGRGMVRSESVVERLDARFKHAALFDRRAHRTTEDDLLADEILRSLAYRKQRQTSLDVLWLRAWEKLGDTRRLRCVSLYASGGALVMASMGGTCGLVTGATVGAAAGTVPAILTFGLSIPAGAVAGGALGIVCGGISFTGVGLIGGGLVGMSTYDDLGECPFEDGDRDVLQRVAETIDNAKTRGEKTIRFAIGTASSVADRACKGVHAAARRTAPKALEFYANVYETAREPKIQVTAASAAVGATAVGIGGGSAGLLIGGGAGVLVGVVPAFLTFGLSIPVCAIVGAGTGLCAGAGVGGAAGLVGGGAAGYGAYTLHKEARTGAGLFRARAETFSRQETPATNCDDGHTGGTD